MELWQAIVLGLVEGLTEFLPVSSTGHLLVTQRLMGLPEGEAANAFAIAIQLGAIVAVLGLYRARVATMTKGLVGQSPEGARLARLVIVAFLPAAVLGLLFDDLIESYLFGPWPIVAAWIVGALVMIGLTLRPPSRGGKSLETLDAKAALLVGLAQCLAMWPGMSRSFAAILGGLLVGLSMTAAVELSFLLGLVTLGAATAYKIVGHGDEMLAAYGPLPLAVGFVCALVSAALSVEFMVRWLEKHSLAIFAGWRLAAAAVVAALVLTNVI
ncbi:MAG: undecaprenyl-diphosphate phosphatase [Sandaracinaceae bacterium]|nr:undecaprenyl-diphosphate phosphatase [Sandaracinaceae bacterium]